MDEIKAKIAAISVEIGQLEKDTNMDQQLKNILIADMKLKKNKLNYKLNKFYKKPKVLTMSFFYF